jgi:hypothetical protein
MAERPFTIAPHSEAEAAVRALLHQIRDIVVAELEPSALLLSGSFARGEGGAYLAGGAVHTTSDVDLIAVYRGPASLVRTVVARRRAARLSARLRRMFPAVRIDLTVRPALLFVWPPATLDYYDLLRSARTLWGAVHLPPPAAVRVDDIPAEELRRALVKRGVGLLAAWMRLDTASDLPTEADARETQSEIDKGFLVCGDVWLHRFDKYDHRLLIRMERMRHLPGRDGPSGSLRIEYDASGSRRLAPGPLVSRSAAPYRARWREAALEWTRAADLLAEWGRRRAAPRGIHPWRHPARAARHAIGMVRRLIRGLPSPARQREALPLLLQLALEDGGGAWLYPTIAGLLRLPPPDRSDLAALIRAFLFAWDGGSGISAQNSEWASVISWRDPLLLPIRRPA